MTKPANIAMLSVHLQMLGALHVNLQPCLLSGSHSPLAAGNTPVIHSCLLP